MPPLCAAVPHAHRVSAPPSLRREPLRRCPCAALPRVRVHAAAGAQSGDAASLSMAAAAPPSSLIAKNADAVVTLTQPVPVPAPSGGVDWRRSWYAVAALDALDPDVPTATTVMGERVAIWRDSCGQWRALRDECPHRLAPLSEGRVAEDGALQCSYHGWRFDGCGACAGVPQDAERAGAAALRSPRSRAAAYPTRCAQGLLWLFAYAGPDAFEASRRAPLPLIPGLDGEPGPAVVESGAPHVRDFPYGMDTLLENLTDPAHVSYSHHGVTGNRNLQPSVPMRVSVPPSARGYEACTPADPGKHPAQLHAFAAPHLLKIKQQSAAGSGGASERGHGAAGGLYLYTTPLAPGRTRVVSRHVSTATLPTGGVVADIKTALRAALQPLSVVPLHMFLNEAFDGDLVFLHEQERALRQARPTAVDGMSATPWRSAYYLATAEDAGVIACRRWFDEFGSGGPFGAAPLPPRVRDRAVLLDRWGQHAVHCAHCRAAGKRAQAAARGLAAAAGVSAAAGLAVLLTPGGSAAAAAALAAASIALAAAARVAQTLDANLRFKDYIHGKR